MNVAKFVKDISTEASHAELLLQITKLEIVADNVIKKGHEEFDYNEEQLNGFFSKVTKENQALREGWQMLVGLCDERILNSEEYVISLDHCYKTFKQHESDLYRLGIGHRVDTYLSRQNTQYRAFLICKNEITSNYDGVGHNFPTDEEFNQIFESAKTRVIENAEKYMKKQIEATRTMVSESN